MFISIIDSLYNESPITSSSLLTTEGHNDNAPSSSEGISEAQRLLLTRVMQRADAKNNSVAPQAETVPLQAEDCSRADLAVARTSTLEEEEEERQKRGSEGAGARAQKRVRRRTHDNAVSATSEEQLKQHGKESKKMKSSVQVGRPQTRRFQE